MPGIANLTKMLKLDEGSNIVNGRHMLYKCSACFWTIGYGYNIEKNGVSEKIAQAMFEEFMTYLLVNPDIRRIIDEHDEIRQSVIVDMAFNLGVKGLLEFRNMLTAFENGDYNLAALEMLDSRWAEQVGHRATRLSYMMRTGTIHGDYN